VGDRRLASAYLRGDDDSSDGKHTGADERRRQPAPRALGYLRAVVRTDEECARDRPRATARTDRGDRQGAAAVAHQGEVGALDAAAIAALQVRFEDEALGVR